MAYETLRTELEDRIMTVTLSRPDRLNALSPGMVRELLEVIDEVDRNDEVRAVIVTGDGRAFCAGADLGGGGGSFDRRGRSDPQAHRDEGGILTLRLFDSVKPWIAAFNGPAVGVGVTMRIARHKARLNPELLLTIFISFTPSLAREDRKRGCRPSPGRT